MTQEVQIAALKGMTNEEDESILLTYLELAGDKILHKAFPFRQDDVVVPERYQGLQIEIACYLLNKRGAEGENYHSENGINRSYESASVPASMLREVTPFVGVPR